MSTGARTSRTWVTRAGSAAILVVALAVRLWGAGHARFLGDEGLFWSTARRIATLEDLPALGASVSGTDARQPSPLLFWFLALPQTLGASPWLGAGFIACLHVLSIAALGWLAREARGERAALCTMALVAVAPWEILSAERVWTPAVMALWGLALLWCTVRFARPLAQGGAALLAVTAPAIHLSAPAAVVACLVALGLGPKLRLRWSALAIGTLLGIATYVPGIVSEVRHDFANSRAILSQGGGNEADASKSRQLPARVALYSVLWSTSELGYHFAEGYFGWNQFDDRHAYAAREGWSERAREHGVWRVAVDTSIAVLALLGWLVSLYVAGRAVMAAVRARARALPLESRITVALVVGLAITTIALVVTRKAFFPHYLAYFSLWLSWPVAMAVDRLVGWARPAPARAALGVLAIGVAAAMLSNVGRYYLTVERKNGMVATVSMVRQVLDGPSPCSIGFEGVNNLFTWDLVAQGVYGRALPLGNPARARYVVRNRAVHAADEPVPANGTLHDGVLLLRHDLR